jgi:hypothetical protein
VTLHSAFHWLLLFGFTANVTAPRGGPHGAFRQGPRNLAGTVNTELETRLRERSVLVIFNWFVEAGYVPEDVLQTPATAIGPLREFVQDAFDRGVLSVRTVKAALQGLADQKYGLLGQLRPVWRLVTSWERGEPSDMRTPLRGVPCFLLLLFGDGMALPCSWR